MPRHGAHPPVDLTRPGRARLIGLAGSGMRSLAALLAGRGWVVEGVDRDEAAARDVLASLPEVEAFAGGSCVAIVSPAVPDDAPTVESARRAGYRVISLPDAIASLTSESRKQPIVVAGTHGKSTTTALLGAILAADGRDPTVWFGAEPRPGDRFLPAGGLAGSGDDVVVEGCEYRRHFLRYRAETAVVTSVEHDHVDCFGDDAEVAEAFGAFAADVPPDGLLVVNGGNRGAVEAAGRAACRVVTFRVGSADESPAGPTREADPPTGYVVARHVSTVGQSLRVWRDGRLVAEIASPLRGRHNAENVAAAVATALERGVPVRAVREAVAGFAGPRRRFELRGRWRGRILIDDYAHHPTAIARTLETVREVYPGRRVTAIFEPHQVSRLTAWPEAHRIALAEADAVVLTDPFGAREADIDQAPLDRLASALATSGRPVVRAGPVGAVDPISAAIHDASRPGDVVITLGAGRISQVHDALSRRFRGRDAA